MPRKKWRNEALIVSFRGSGEIERTRAARAWAFDDVEVDQGGEDVGMAEGILDGADVSAALEQTGCGILTE